MTSRRKISKTRRGSVSIFEALETRILKDDDGWGYDFGSSTDDGGDDSGWIYDDPSPPADTTSQYDDSDSSGYDVPPPPLPDTGSDLDDTSDPTPYDPGTIDTGSDFGGTDTTSDSTDTSSAGDAGASETSSFTAFDDYDDDDSGSDSDGWIYDDPPADSGSSDGGSADSSGGYDVPPPPFPVDPPTTGDTGTADSGGSGDSGWTDTSTDNSGDSGDSGWTDTSTDNSGDDTGDSGCDDGGGYPVYLYPPLAPTNLTAQAAGDTIQLAWTAGSSNATGYTIDRFDSSGRWQTLRNVDVSQTTFTDTTVQPGEMVTYAVAAFNQDGTSYFSNDASAFVSLAGDPTLFGQFGHIAGQPNTPFHFIDNDGTEITLTLTGPGSAQLHLTTDGYTVALANTTLASSLNIQTQNDDADTSDGRFTLNTLTIGNPADANDHTALRALVARTTDLTGDMAIAGPAANISLGDLTGSDISIGAALEKTPAATLHFGQVRDSSLTVAGGISLLTVTSWHNTDSAADLIASPFITTLRAAGNRAAADAGNFEAALSLTGVGVAAKGKTLGNATIAGALAPVAWNIAGNVGSVTVAGNIGITGDAFTLDSPAAITSLTFRGTANAAIHTAGNIGALTLTSPAAINTLDISVNSIRTLTVRGNLINSMITLTQTPDKRNAAITTATIGGELINSEIRSAGNIGTFRVRSMTNSRLFAGVLPGVSTLPSSAADFVSAQPADLPIINRIVLTGSRTMPHFINSNIAAGRLGSVMFPGISPALIDAGGASSPFGLSTRLGVARYVGPASTGLFVSGKDSIVN